MIKHQLNRFVRKLWLLILIVLSGVPQSLHAAEDNMEVEYSPFSYTCWQPNTDLSPDNDAIQFNFCYYNDYRLDSWCSGIYIYVDDELVGKMTNMAGDEHDNTFFLTEKVSINSSKNGKVEAQTLAFQKSGSNFWAKVQIRIQYLGYNKNHKIKVGTNWTPNRGDSRWEEVVFWTHSNWKSMPTVGSVSSVGRNRARWTNTSSPAKQEQHVYILKQNQATDKWVEPDDNNSVFSKMVVSANRNNAEESFDCDFDVESNYMPTTFYPRYFFKLSSYLDGNRYLFDYCNSFQTLYYYRAKDVKYSFDQWQKAVTLTWDTECYAPGASTDGKWMIFRVQDETAKLAGTTSGFHDRTFTDKSSSIKVDQDYTYKVYFLPNSWGEATQSKCADDLMASAEVSTPFDYDVQLTAEGQDRSIKLSWDAPAILANGDYQYTVYRSVGNGSFETLKKISVSNLEQTHYEYEDSEIPNSSASYNYYVGIKLMGKDFESNKHVASVSGFSRVTEVKASKGGYDNTVKVNWKAQLLGTTTTYYELSRRVLNSQADWETIYTTSGTGVNYSYNDQTLSNGVYYEYRVLSYNLNDQNERYGEAEALSNGFCSLAGTISGNINYGNGTAVADVRVNLELDPNSNQSDLSQFYSLRSNGANGGIRWNVEKNTAEKKLAGKTWTTQFYLRPSNECLTPVIFEADGVTLSLGNFQSADSTFALMLNGTAVDSLRLHTDMFTHITMAYKGAGNFVFYTIDRDGQMNTATATSSAYKGFGSDETTLYFAASSSNDADKGYVGHIDDVRFFAGKVLTADEVRKDYDHTLTGQEKGLLAYWPLDEGLNGQRDAYDYSSSNGSPNENHGELLPNGKVDNIVPEKSQLSIYAMTDETGNYIIRGIHYQGNGTNYVVRPQKGIHEFSPRTLTRYISATSNVYSSSSFTDESSFPVSGVVYYEGTNYPVEDCYVKIDGTVVSLDGELVKTDKNGRFSIDVPIGNHYVSVERNGHTFTMNGRYPETGKHDFDREVKGLTFWDNTLVMVTGRVDGGAIEQARPMGFGSSVNNIGVAEIELEADYMINATQQTIGSAIKWDPANQPRHFEDGNPNVANSIVSGYGSADAAKRITITTDRLTGEFSAMLPPIHYTVKSVRVLSNPDLDFGEYSAHIDASNASAEFTDSLKNENTGEMDYFKYVAKFNLAYRSTPQLEVSDPDADEGAMGIKTYKFTHADRTTEDIAIYTVDDQGNVNYTYKYPVFLQLDKYKLNFRGFERYENHDEGAPVAYQDVPLKDVGVNIANQFSVANHFYQKDGTLALVPASGISLDSLGRATYVFQVGAPCLLEEENFSRALSISYDIKGNRFSLPDIRGIVFGNIPTGSNFVTAGPDQVLMVLRDPPGSGSSYTWEKGTSHTMSTVHTHNHMMGDGFSAEVYVGIKLATATGTPGAMVINTEEHMLDTGHSISTSQTWFFSNEWVTTTTLTKSVSTSSDPQFDGPDADVFIGRSTNIIIGRARDIRLHLGDDDRPHLGMKEVYTMGSEFETEFSYTQYYVRNTLIPNLIETRNNLILPKGTVVERDEMICKYVSLVDQDDPSFGQEGSYECLWPKKTISTAGNEFCGTDSVAWCNEQVKRWKKIMENNECAKVLAIDNRSEYLYKNYSFDAGSSVTVTDEKSKEYIHGSTFEENVSYQGHIGKSVGNDVHSADLDWNWSYNYTYNDTDTESNAESESFSFTLAEEQPFDALTVDVFNAPDNFGHIFVTRGGQTSGNWEPQQVTHYYRPGTEIMAQTQKVSVPKIYIEIPIVSNVPVGEPAVFKVRFANESETRSTVPVVIGMDNGTNPSGAEVLAGGGTVNQGIEDVLSYGAPVEHTVTISQTDYDVLDYRIGLILFDSWQATPSVYPANSDTAYIEAHFVPASSKVALATSTPYINSEVTEPASFTLSDYNLNLRNLRTVSIRHKGVNDQEWTVDKVWNTLSNCNTAEDSLLAVTDAQIHYDIDMSNPRQWPEQKYLFQAVTMSVFGDQKEYYYGNEVEVVKDISSPVVIGSPSPSNGILLNNSDISVSFNEDIRGELLTADDNILVIGRLNNSTLTHDIAARFANGQGAVSEAKMAFNGNAMSVNLWMRWKEGAGTIYAQGDLNIGIDNMGHLTVGADGQEIVSNNVLPSNEWIFLSVCLDNTSSELSVTADAATADETMPLFDMIKFPGDISMRGTIGIGNKFAGEIHEVSAWDYARPFSVAVTECSKAKNQYTSHLMGYWPMNEGYGTVIHDLVAQRNLSMQQGTTWYVDGENYSLELTPEQVAAVNLSNCATDNDDDYLLQLWFRAESVNATGTDIFNINDSKTRLSVSGNDGHLSLFNGNIETIVSADDLRDGNWHQFSMMVHKSTNANANLYLDGKSVALIPSENVANLGGLLRMGGGLKGNVDELRIIHDYFTSDIIVNNIYQRSDSLNASAMGLRCYYPFEKTIVNTYGQNETVSTLIDQGTGRAGAIILEQGEKLTSTSEEAPTLKMASSIQNVAFDFFTTERTIYITLKESPATIQGCQLYVTVRDVKDYAGNTLDQVTWSFTVDDNSLSWVSLDMTKVFTEQSSEDDYKIYCYVYNLGTEDKVWTLEGVPEWLDVNETAGTIKLGGYVELKINVSEALPTGINEGQIYLVDGNGISHAIPYSFTKLVNRPNWSVASETYPNTMSMVGQVKVDDTIQENPYSIIAAFDETDRCIGQASPVFYSRYGTSYVLLTIYGNQESGKPLRFRYYDANTGTISPSFSMTLNGQEQTPAFRPNAHYGDFGNPYLWLPDNKIEQTTSVVPGWQWLSLYAEPSDASLDSIFNIYSTEGEPCVTEIVQQDAYARRETDGTWSGELTTIETGKMYKVYAAAAGNIDVIGQQAATLRKPITINPYWNWLGANVSSPLMLSTALADMSPEEGDIIKNRQKMAIYSGGAWTGDLRVLTPGEGYFYLSNAEGNKEFIYPTSATNTGKASSAKTSFANATDEDNRHFGSYNPARYDGTMTITAVVECDNVRIGGCELASFLADGELCGDKFSHDEDNRRLIYMVVHADKQQEISFRVAVRDADGNVTDYELEQSLSFEDGASLGSTTNPVVFRLETTGIRGVKADSQQNQRTYKSINENKEVIIHQGSNTYNASGVKLQKQH